MKKKESMSGYDLRILRRKRKFSQEKLARQLDCSTKTIVLWENSSHKLKKMAQLAIERLFNVEKKTPIIFQMETSGHCYPDENTREKMERYGFIFEIDSGGEYFSVNKPKIEIKSVEELLKIIEDFQKPIILALDSRGHKTLEIYDSCRE